MIEEATKKYFRDSLLDVFCKKIFRAAGRSQVFLKIWQNSQENNCARVSEFLF